MRDPDVDSIERESEPVAAARELPPAPIVPEPTTPSAARAPPPPPPETMSESSKNDARTTPLPRLFELSMTERNALPPLKQSMHVFNEDPGARFVLIDGRRYTEGEKLAASLQIVAIRRDGTEMDFNGRRFLLPRP
jgi:hypothetical protein